MQTQLDKWPDAIHESGHAAAAHYLGWPVREVSIQAAKTSHSERVGSCRLGIDPLPNQSHEDVLRKIIFLTAGPAAEYLLNIELEPGATTEDYAQVQREAAHAFPGSQKAQAAIIKHAQEAAFDLVRTYRPGIEALAAALMRLGRIEGHTAVGFLSTKGRTVRT